MAPVRTPDDLSAYLAFNRKAWTPLRYLSDADRAAFVESLVFTEHGLASFRTDIFGKLAPAEVYMVLAVFDAQHMIASIPLKEGGDPLDAEVMKSARAAPACVESSSSP